jgi:hypothetical protein
MIRVHREASAVDQAGWHAGWWLTGALIYGVLVLSRSLHDRVTRSPRRRSAPPRVRENAMGLQTAMIYASPNGDRWTLVRDTRSGDMVVRHEPNRASGGQTSEIDVEAFLARTGQAPEAVALRRLLTRA